MVRPIKPAFARFQEYEDRVLEVIYSALGVPYPLPDCVKHADLVALVTERRDLMVGGGIEWEGGRGVEPDEYPVDALDPVNAYLQFDNWWERLSREVK